MFYRAFIHTLYISVYRLRVWSFTQLTRMIVAQQGNNQSTQINFVHSSSPLHDLLATPTSTTVNTTLNKSRSFQVCYTVESDIRIPFHSSETESYTETVTPTGLLGIHSVSTCSYHRLHAKNLLYLIFMADDPCHIQFV